MKNINNLESRDGHRIYFTVRNKPDGSKEQFFVFNFFHLILEFVSDFDI